MQRYGFAGKQKRTVREFDGETGEDESKNSTGPAQAVFLTPELDVRFETTGTTAIEHMQNQSERQPSVCLTIGLVVLSVWQLH